MLTVSFRHQNRVLSVLWRTISVVTFCREDAYRVECTMALRWYDPVTGRWLSKDPIGIAGGLNQYVFCGNNPLNRRDPFGLVDLDLATKAERERPGYTKNVIAPEGFFSVRVHYEHNSFWMYGRRATITQVATAIREAGLKESQSVYLVSCAAGKGGVKSAAQKLADILAVTTGRNEVIVRAATERVWVAEDGRMIVAPRHPKNRNIPHPTKRGKWDNYIGTPRAESLRTNE